MIVLLAVKPGPLRDGLDALLYATPEMQLVAHATIQVQRWHSVNSIRQNLLSWKSERAKGTCWRMCQK